MPGGAASAAELAPVGVIDRIRAVGTGTVEVGGWAYDPDTPDPALIHVYVDDRLVTAVRASGPRPDVAARFGRPTTGFLTLVEDLTPGGHTVCVWGIDEGSGPNRRLACASVTVPDGSPFGVIDRIVPLGSGRLEVSGWAVDPDGDDPPMHVYVDDRLVGSTVANRSRPDVAARFGDDDAGFSTVLTDLPHATSEVCVWALDGAGGRNQRLGCARVNVTADADPAARGRLVINGAGDVRADPWWYGSPPDYAQALAGLGGLFGEDDLTVVNLECAPSLSGAPVPKNYNFRCAPDALARFATDGVDVASLANNHALDYGTAALVEGIDNVWRSGLAEVGAGLDDVDAHQPVLFTRQGWRIAVLGLAGFVEFDWNLAAPGRPGLADGYDIGRMQAAVRAAAEDSDLVIVAIHWGREGVTVANQSQIDRGRALIDAGADVVFGHHPHRLQPVERYGDGLIFYSLGNFVWPWLSTASADTAVGQVVIEPDGSRRACLLPATIAPHGRPSLDDPARRTC